MDELVVETDELVTCPRRKKLIGWLGVQSVVNFAVTVFVVVPVVAPATVVVVPGVVLVRGILLVLERMVLPLVLLLVVVMVVLVVEVLLVVLLAVLLPVLHVVVLLVVVHRRYLRLLLVRALADFVDVVLHQLHDEEPEHLVAILGKCLPHGG